MKRLFIMTSLLTTMLVPVSASAEDTTLLLTLKSEVDGSQIQNDLRLGLWKNGKEGFDPLDTSAFPNGIFDAYFEIPPDHFSSPQILWWDIRSTDPHQEWRLFVKSPQVHSVTLEWRQVPYSDEKTPVLFFLKDPETGKETALDQGKGELTFTVQGTKSFIIKSFPQ